MLIETPEVLAKAKSEDTTSRKGIYSVCVCVLKRTQLVWGRGVRLEKSLQCDADPRRPAPVP